MTVRTVLFAFIIGTLTVQAQEKEPEYEIEFIINGLPASTPHDASIYLAGSLADWYPDVSYLKFEKKTRWFVSSKTHHQP